MPARALEKYTPKKLSRKEYDLFLKKIPTGTCLVCEYRQYQIIICAWRHWVLIEPISPYFSHHVMLCPKRHVDYLEKLNSKEQKEFWRINQEIMKAYTKSGVRRIRLQIHARYKINNSLELHPNHLHIHYYRFKRNDFAHLIPKNIHTTKTVKRIAANLKKTRV